MRKSLRRRLKIEAIHAMSRVPGYELFESGSADLWRGEVAFVRRMPGDLWLVVIFAPHEKADSFTVELGWSTHGSFPELGVRPSPEFPKRGRSAHTEDEYVTRLGSVTGDGDTWWRVRSEADVSEKTQTAVNALRRFGLLFLEDEDVARTGP